MQKHLSSLAVATVFCLTVLTPYSASAYLSAEEVFGLEKPSTFDRTDPAVTQTLPQQRAGEQVVQTQQQAAASSRAAAQQSLVPLYADPVDTYVPPTQQASSLGLFDDNTQYDLRQERAAESRVGGPTIIIGNDGSVVDSDGNVLHSGAPRVTATGPESVLTFMALVLAAFSTLGYAALRAKQQKILA
jgi:hypothetical protein